MLIRQLILDFICLYSGILVWTLSFLKHLKALFGSRTLEFPGCTPNIVKAYKSGAPGVQLGHLFLLSDSPA